MEHELEAAKRLSKNKGINNFEFYPASSNVTDIYEEKKKYEANPALLASLPDACKSLWTSIYIQPDGSVMPCSLAFRKTESFGNLLAEDIMSLWNNENYTIAREMSGKKEKFRSVLPCKGCKYSLKCGKK